MRSIKRLALLGSLLAACSSTSAASPTDAGVDASGPLSAKCPAQVPSSGDDCTPLPTLAQLQCEYGGDANRQCTTLATCSGTPPIWRVQNPSPGCGTNAASCPAAFGAMEGQRCDRTSAPSCTYAEGVCGCIECQSDGAFSAFWHCRTWSDGASSDCPWPRPLAGEACNATGYCAYDACCGGPAMGPLLECRDGVWLQAAVDPACSCRFAACP